ncbi:ParB/RepB/Spo0J family partition protein [Streptomyces nigrescens]|uniref:ParB/RepB/Spo0J family partition protein n=1 Tax=Streptomyces nigrescens TaxID=1920 RepID=UPI0036F565A5
MPKHDEFDDFFDDDDDAPIVDTRADGRLYRVPLGRLAANLVNPREDFGTEDQLMDLGKSLARRQIQACPVVTRGAYLKLWPDHAKQIGDVDYVLVTGERRFRGATAVGLHSLNCVADDNVAVDRKTFMEAVVSENVDRQNFDPVEEAYAVQALVTEFGSNRAVAQHFERADGWVTQRILLTHLAPEVQKMVRQRAIPLEHARKLGKLTRDEELSAEDQVAWWKRTQQELLGAKEEKKAAKKAKPAAAPPSSPPPSEQPAQASDTSGEPKPEGGQPASVPDPRSSPDPGEHAGQSFTAVKPSALRTDSAEGAGGHVEKEPSEDAAEAASPAPAASAEADAPEKGKASQPRQLPYDEPFYVVQHLRLKMTGDVFVQGGRIWMAAMREHHPEAYESLLRELTKQGAESV